MNDFSEHSAESLFLRSTTLMMNGRYRDAESFLRQGLALDPNNTQSLYFLSLCVGNDDNREKEAVNIIDRAIELDPESAEFHVHKARMLATLNKPKEAHASADQALSLDPESEDALAAKGVAYLKENRWADAEKCARQALELNADNQLAMNVLSQALQWQGKAVESQMDVAARLARNPDDEMTHFNAGYAALRARNYAAAETHFKEALRLDPDFEGARQGLLECFRSRSIVYRAYLRYTFAMGRLQQKHQIALMVGIYVVYRMLRTWLATISPILSGGLVMLYVVFALWTYVGRGLGNLIVLLDRQARHALKRREVWEGILVGGGIVVGFLLVILGIFVRQPLSLISGLCLIGLAIPLALSLGNDHQTGKYVYGVLAATAVVSAIILVFSLGFSLGNKEVVAACIKFGGGSIAIASLLAMFGILYE